MGQIGWNSVRASLTLNTELFRRAKRRLLPTRSKLLWPALQEEAMRAILSASEHVGPVLHVTTALSRAGWGDFSPEEKVCIARIEERRRVTNSSKEVVQYRDYGAGNPETGRTASEMAEGKVINEVVGKISRIASKSPASAALLFSLVRQQKPARCIEMGTCVGISAAYIASALRLNGHGKLITLEGGIAVAEVARQNLASLSLEGAVKVVVGPFHETLLNAFKTACPIDFIFVDGHHDEEATKNYFANMLPFLAPLSVAVFDDINWSEGMKRAWSSITAAPQCTARFSLSDFGIAVLRSEG